MQAVALDVVKKYPNIAYKIIVADFAKSDDKNLYDSILK